MKTLQLQIFKSVREQHPEMKIIVHPECTHEVVSLSDMAGSTNYIIKAIENADPGSSWAIGTEHNLVNRIIQEHPDKKIISLNPYMCSCLTMNRIDLPHLAWILESLKKAKNTISLKSKKMWQQKAKLALDRMLQSNKSDDANRNAS